VRRRLYLAAHNAAMSTIDLVMIARDESRCIERCLQSARPWVDAMIVLDTGSVDDTVPRAQRAGARVERFAWVDDFAAARNAALQLSRADWQLVLDADEWVDSGGEALAAVHRAAAPFIGQILVSSRCDGVGGDAVASSWLPRVLPRGVRYAGRIHEQPMAELPRRRLPVVVGHDGYLAARMAEKSGRNERLLRLALAEQPDDAYWRYQLGKDFEVRGQFDAAEPHYVLAHRLAAAHAGWRHDLVVRLLFTLKKTRRFEQAMALAEAELVHWPHSPDFFFTLGDVLLDWAALDPARGVELLPMIESCWLRALEIGEQPDLQDTVAGRGSFLAAHNLAVLHESLGHRAQAEAWRERERLLRGAAEAASRAPPPT
jgi:glycosyltransferase involved in cell wall biosynthesis